MKAAHDKAMFGAPLLPPSPEKDEEDIKSTKDETTESAPVSNLISDQVKKHSKFLMCFSVCWQGFYLLLVTFDFAS